MMRDTPDEVEQQVRALYAALDPWERVRMAFQMFESAKELVAAGIRMQHPAISDTELRRRVFHRIYHDCYTPDEFARIDAALFAEPDCGEVQKIVSQ